jgi:phosphomethylpyrimidine synthase
VNETRRREYIASATDPSVRVPVRVVDLTDGTTFSIYDTSGPGSEPTVGLPALRAAWIEARGDTEVVAGRVAQARDDGRGTKPVEPWRGPAPVIRRAAPGKTVTHR